MLKKGIAKFWIEIIGGVIIVVVILLIFVYFGSAVSTAMEDAANKKTFSDLQGLMAKAMEQGEETLNPFKLSVGTDNRIYAIAYVPRDVADCFYNPSSCSAGKTPLAFGDTTSKFEIQKCTQQELQSSDYGQDICMCLFRIDYKGGCDEGAYNMITTSTPSGASWLADMLLISDASTGWGTTKMLESFNEGSYDYAISNIKILDCARVIQDVRCSYTEGNTEYPCLLHYDGKTVVWMSADGGLVFHDQLYVESFILKKSGWHLDITMDGKRDGTIHEDGRAPCNTGGCSSSC